MLKAPSRTLLLATLFCAGASAAGATPPPAPEAALSISPLYGVDYDRPPAQDIKRCTVDLDKEGKGSSWVVRNPDGVILRRFADTNADNQVDAWCYYKDGLEVYRDIDSNYDRKADQHRWYNTGGSKFGVDEDQDEQIDYWKRISPQEVAEELVEAIKNKDNQAFERLLLRDKELDSLELPRALRAQFAKRVASATKGFQEVASTQRVLSAGSRYVDFGAAKPGALPAALNASGPEAVVHEGASALVESGGKTEQVQLGVLVQAGDAWRLVDAPQLGGDDVELSSVFAFSRFTGGAGAAAPPSDQMQKLMEELEKLDARRATLPPAEQAKLIGEREQRLLALIKATDDPQLREQWYSQLADMYSAAAMEGVYPKGVSQLQKLEKALVAMKASRELIAHVVYLRIWSDWVLNNQNPKMDFAKVQDNWTKQLRAFVKQYPKTDDAAEAYLQLGMTLEFAGETDEALEYYQTLAKDFAGSSKGEKGRGAVRRLNSVGKTFALQGPGLDGKAVNLAAYRGKHVLVQYWATWYEPSKTEMAVIAQAVAKHRRAGFEVLGVNLDTSPAAARAYLAENRYPWRHAFDQDGLEGRLANEMGVMTLPLMILVDDQGKVVNRNLHVSDLDDELKRVLK